MNINEIQDLIKFVAKAGVNEVEIEKKDFKLVIKSDYMAKKKTNFKEETKIVQQISPVSTMHPPMVQPQVIAEVTKSEKKEEIKEDSNLVTIKAQMIGTFYRSSAPEKPPFVEVGSVIKSGDTLCIIEAMKLFNEIESEVSGRIVKVLVDDVSPVEFDQPLFLIDPNI
jgi:acetyl-CoA carboxylase biotin carboxyl carrier protein